jgi:PEP-CTERM motif
MVKLKILFLCLAAGFVTISMADPITITAGTVHYEIEPVKDNNWIDVNDLDHDYAYIWKINLDGIVGEDEVITKAMLFFDDIRNWDNNYNIIRASVLDVTTPPLQAPQDDHIFAVKDNQNPSDYFSINYDIHYTDATSVGNFVNLSTTATDQTMVFSSVAISDLNAFKADNNWIGIGLDPDCHYYNNGVKLIIEKETQSVPEPSILSLLGFGLLTILGISRYRRRK